MKHVKVIKDGKTTVIENQTNQIINIFVANQKELKGLFYDFAIVNLEFFKWLSTQKISGRQCRILHYLISKMQFENRVTITHQEVSQQLKIYKSDLSKELKKLEERCIIMREKIASKTYEVKLNLACMYLNQAMIYKGNPKDRKKVKEHKYLASLNVPYHQRKNLFGDYDIIDKETGEILAIGNKNISKEYPVKNETKENVIIPEKVEEKDIITQQSIEIADKTIENRELKEKIKKMENEEREALLEWKKWMDESKKHKEEVEQIKAMGGTKVIEIDGIEIIKKVHTRKVNI